MRKLQVSVDLGGPIQKSERYYVCITSAFGLYTCVQVSPVRHMFSLRRQLPCSCPSESICLTSKLPRQAPRTESRPDLRCKRSIMALVPAAFPAVLQAVSSTSLLAITVFCCVPPLHKPVRKFVRPWVVFHVQRGFGWVRFFQKHQSSLVTFLSSVSSQSVSVPF